MFYYIGFGIIGFCLFLMWRTVWVLEKSSKIIWERSVETGRFTDRYKRLASVDEMMVKFWCFDIEKFIKPQEGG